MYFSSGYLNNNKLPFKDRSKPIIVGSCGAYRLTTKKRLPTWSPRGRVDYQLLYVAAGKAHFYIGGEDNVGIGSDFDGVDYLPQGVDGCQDIEKIIKMLPYPEKIRKKIAYENFLRVLKAQNC